jgi:acetolactate synthase small subunit
MRVSFEIKTHKTRGVLLRVISLFHRLALDLDGLVFKETAEPNVASLHLTLECEQEATLRIKAQLLKVVEVVSVETKAGRN